MLTYIWDDKLLTQSFAPPCFEGEGDTGGEVDKNTGGRGWGQRAHPGLEAGPESRSKRDLCRAG